MRSLLVALLALGTAACLRSTATDPDASSNGNSNGNNPSDASGGNNGSGNPMQDASTGNGNHDSGTTGNPDAGMQGPPCKNKVTGVGTGHHHPGEDCMNACHNHGFTLAGTVYSSASGGSYVSGASITVKDAAGHMFDIVSQADGNFYTSTSVQFPVTVYASECQLSQMSQVMTDPVTSTQRGGCNANGCHTPGAQGYIHLP